MFSNVEHQYKSPNDDSAEEIFSLSDACNRGAVRFVKLGSRTIQQDKPAVFLNPTGLTGGLFGLFGYLRSIFTACDTDSTKRFTSPGVLYK